MATPASWENTLRIHDDAIFKWLGNLRVDYGGPSDFPDTFPFAASYPPRQNFPILRTMATRQRAWAQVLALLVSMRWIDSGTAAQIRQSAGDFAVLPLPVCVFERGDPESDPTAGSVPKRFQRSHFNQATGQWESHRWPGTYLTPYRVTFWCSKRYTEAFMREWLQAQLGQLGASDREVFIPVEHAEPWGTQWQMLRFDGSSDLSDLEGDEPRAIRYEVTFNLRMLHMRPDVETAYPINSTAVPIVLGQIGDVDGADPFDLAPDLPNAPQVSDNLFFQYYAGDQIAAKWPKDGAATVAKSNIAPPTFDAKRVIKATVRAVADHVGVTNRPVLIGAAPSDIAILSVGMRYIATAEVGLRVFERPGTNATPVWSSVRNVVLPARTSWTDFQFFTFADQSIISVEFEGRAISSTVHFTDVDVRHVYSQTRVAPTGSGPGLYGSTKFTWNALPTFQSYLVVVIPDTRTGQWDIRLDDDETSPDHVIQRTLDLTTERGYVEIVQPKAGSIALSLPSGFPSATVFVQPFSNGFRSRLP